LTISLGKNTRCRVGILGSFSLESGTYLYTGSARGSGSASIEGRIERHLGKRGRVFWHIDYPLSLRRCKVSACVYSVTVRYVECAVSRRIQELTDGVFPVYGFGSSDCNCRSHLIYLQSYNTARTLASVTNAYRTLHLKPKLWNPNHMGLA
jgi:Uri superfamily endonuclease